MKIVLGTLLVINAVSAVVNFTVADGTEKNNVIGFSNLVVACFLAVALAFEMLEGSG